VAPIEVRCPHCKKAVEWSSPFKPFCSERCRLLDLGAWLSEEHAIPGAATDPDPEAAPVEPKDRSGH